MDITQPLKAKPLVVPCLTRQNLITRSLSLPRLNPLNISLHIPRNAFSVYNKNLNLKVKGCRCCYDSFKVDYADSTKSKHSIVYKEIQKTCKLIIMVMLGFSMSSMFCGHLAMAKPFIFEAENPGEKFCREHMGGEFAEIFLPHVRRTPTSVIKLQVGLKADKGIQEDLDRMGATTDTLSSSLQETIIPKLLKYSNNWMSAYSSVYGRKNIEKAEKRFTKLYKALKETTHSVIAESFDASSENHYTVVTILVVAVGVHKPPPIGGWNDLIKALQFISSIPMKEIHGVIIFQNQYEEVALSMKKLHEDHPFLKHLLK